MLSHACSEPKLAPSLPPRARDVVTAAFLLSAANYMSLAGDLPNVIAGPIGYWAGTCADLEVRAKTHTLCAG